MQIYQNLTDHELTIPNIGVVPPRGTIETDLELNNPNLKPIINQSPAAAAPSAPAPQSFQAAPELQKEQEGEN